jgi:hypothetical protein
MGKTSVQNITQSTSNIGEAQRPYYDRAMQGAAGLLTAKTPMYDRDRLEGFTAQQKKLQGEVAGMGTPSQFGTATNIANQAGVAALNAGNYDPAAQYQAANYDPAGNYNAAQFNVQQVQNPELNMYQMEGAGQFGNEQAQQYMSPYFQNVLDIQKREAATDAQKSQLMQNLGAARQGTYGGSRQLLAGLSRERDLGTKMGDIQAKGLQDAYANAQLQFERDRAAGFSVKDANLRAALSVQELGAKNSLAAQQANQQYGLEGQRLGEQSRQFGADFGEKSRLDAAKFGEQSRQFGSEFNEKSRQFGADLGLKGAESAGQMAQTLANIGQTQQNADAQRLGMQQSTAAQEQALEQQKRDLDYADFQKEASDPYTRLQQYMNVMSGVPQAMSTTTTQSAPSPGLAQQLAGAGLGAYSTYKMFSGG